MRKKRIPRPMRAPCLVVMQTLPEVSISERMAIDSFMGGWADKAHFNILLDCYQLLALAAEHKGATAELTICELAHVALANIRDRFDQTGKFGMTGDERKALIQLADVSQDFWKRQSGELFRQAHIGLEKLREGVTA